MEYWSDAPLQAKEHQRLPANYQKLARSKEEFPYRFQKKHGPNDTFFLMTPLIQNFSLQNCETIYVCYFKSLSLQYFVTAALENLCKAYPVDGHECGQRRKVMAPPKSDHFHLHPLQSLSLQNFSIGLGDMAFPARSPQVDLGQNRIECCCF